MAHINQICGSHEEKNKMITSNSYQNVVILS